MPERYEHTGNAVPTTLSSGIGSGDTSITLALATGWPTGATGKFWAVINRGQGTEEKILVTSRSGAVLTVSARGADGTSAQAHSAGETVEHSWSATEADDASAHIMASTNVHGLTGGAAVVGTSQAQVMTNKTIDGASNTLTVPQSQVTSLVGDQATQNTRLTDLETDVASLESGATGGPTGAITAYAGSAAPTGWLLCDGAAVSRSTFAALFAVVGTTYGAGDGSTTFNVPNLKGRIPVGRDAAQTEFDALAETGGAKTHTLTTAELPAHDHNPIHSDGSAVQRIQALEGAPPTSNRFLLAVGSEGLTATSVGSGTAHNNLQPYLTLNYVIKH